MIVITKEDAISLMEFAHVILDTQEVIAHHHKKNHAQKIVMVMEDVMKPMEYVHAIKDLMTQLIVNLVLIQFLIVLHTRVMHAQIMLIS